LDCVTDDGIGPFIGMQKSIQSIQPVVSARLSRELLVLPGDLDGWVKSKRGEIKTLAATRAQALCSKGFGDAIFWPRSRFLNLDRK